MPSIGLVSSETDSRIWYFDKSILQNETNGPILSVKTAKAINKGKLMIMISDMLVTVDAIMAWHRHFYE